MLCATKIQKQNIFEIKTNTTNDKWQLKSDIFGILYGMWLWVVAFWRRQVNFQLEKNPKRFFKFAAQITTQQTSDNNVLCKYKICKN